MAEVHREIVEPPRPESRRTVLDHYACDLCGAVGHVGAWGDVSWRDQGDGNVAETEVMWATGYSSPDGGTIRKHRVDICLDCLTGVVLPILLEKGAKPRIEVADF